MFSLSDEQWKKMHVWFAKIQEEVAAKQWNNPKMREQMLDEKTPYGGAIGGALTYSFTPTGLGTVVKVTEGFSNQTIDLTDYEDW
jgi:hypothetical protein